MPRFEWSRRDIEHFSIRVAREAAWLPWIQVASSRSGQGAHASAASYWLTFGLLALPRPYRHAAPRQPGHRLRLPDDFGHMTSTMESAVACTACATAEEANAHLSNDRRCWFHEATGMACAKDHFASSIDTEVSRLGFQQIDILKMSISSMDILRT